jgi:pilus assembly protein Flp/PilA
MRPSALRRKPSWMHKDLIMNNLIAKAHLALINFKKNESGASLIEYSLLVGLITVGVVLTVVAVGGWVNGQWLALQNAVAPAPAP